MTAEETQKIIKQIEDGFEDIRDNDNHGYYLFWDISQLSEEINTPRYPVHTTCTYRKSVYPHVHGICGNQYTRCKRFIMNLIQMTRNLCNWRRSCVLITHIYNFILFK